MRTRDLGIVIGFGRPGLGNAITDVADVQVGHTTIIEGDGPLVVGKSPIRTVVTIVIPRGPGDWGVPVFAGCHRLNGNGEMTGLEWIRESGFLTGPIAITNTHSVGVVRDALVAASLEVHPRVSPWSLPVVGETWDGWLNDVDGFHVRAEHLRAALASAASGPVREGNIGGGTGMVCHGFKGGIGTASHILPADLGGHTVGVLVQANHVKRAWLRVDGVPVGAEIGPDEVPVPGEGPRDPGDVRRLPVRARSSSSSPPTPRSCPTSASGSRNAPVSGSPGRAGRAATRAAISSRRSRPATGSRSTTSIAPRRLRTRHERSATVSSTRSSTARSRRPKRRSSTRSSRPRRWSGATA